MEGLLTTVRMSFDNDESRAMRPCPASPYAFYVLKLGHLLLLVSLHYCYACCHVGYAAELLSFWP
ncbi:hypothetical protein Mapa_009633 [Marchantia paleacea]|nr:hypothetical protein Mapa_009633 [Marchantia paleacea]